MLKATIVVWRDICASSRAFASAELEQAFLADYARRVAPQRRAMMVLGCFVWLSYIVWDIFNAFEIGSASEHMVTVAWLRLIGFLIGLAIVVAAGSKLLERSEPAASALAMCWSVSAFAICYYMLRVVPPFYGHAYYGPALLIVMLSSFAVFRLRAAGVVWVMALYVVCPSVLMKLEIMWRPDVDLLAEQIYIWRFSTLLFGAGLVGAALGQQLERAERLNFLREHDLAQSSLEVSKQNEELKLLNEAISLASRHTEEKALALIDLKEQMRADAERRNTEKSQFLAGAVHDLRQPLQAIGNALDPARRTLAHGDIATASSMLALAQSAANLMAGQLAAMLEISRLESGLVSTETASLDLRSLVAGTMAQLEEAAAREGVRLSLHAPPDAEVWVRSDPHFIGRILQNLVGNGIKYSDPAKPLRQVRVSLANHPSCVRLEVEDNGIGIAPEHLAGGAIFKPFYQVRNRRRQAEKGVGLGLAIVAALVRLMRDHRLDVASRPGRGTCIVLEIPHGDREARPRVADNHASAEAGPSATTARLSGLYVVLVEDDELVSTATCALLKAHGALHEAVDSVDAFERLMLMLERTPDVVLTDFRLPEGRTALDVIQCITQQGLALPTVVFTGESLQPGAIEAIEPAAILYKPVPPAELVRAIDLAVQQALQKPRDRNLKQAPGEAARP